MARPDLTKTWASSRLSIPAISDPDYAKGFLDYLGSQPPTTDDHDYIMNLQDQRAVWLGEQMLLAVGHEWQSDVSYDAYAIVRSPVDSQLYRSLSGANIGNEPSVSPGQWSPGIDVSSDLLNTLRIDVASASTIDLASNASSTRHINITGGGTINSFTVTSGQCYFVRFAAAGVLVNSASLVTQSGGNINVSSGDTCIIRAIASDVVELLCYVKASNSTALKAANGWHRLPSGIIEQWGVYTVNTAGLKTITLPISFTTANYGALVSDSTTSSSSARPVINALSLNDFTSYIDSSTVTNPLGVVFWRCWGF